MEGKAGTDSGLSDFNPDSHLSPRSSPQRESRHRAGQRQLHQSRRGPASRSSPLRNVLRNLESGSPSSSQFQDRPSQPSLRLPESGIDPQNSSQYPTSPIDPSPFQGSIPERLKRSQIRQSVLRALPQSLSPSSDSVSSRSPSPLPDHVTQNLPPYRPNRYFGPPSTYRSWIQNEYIIARSIERARAQNLAVHLYNAYILQQKADRAGRNQRGRSGSRSRSRSRSRGRSVQAQRRNRSKSAKDKKGKGKAREDDHEDERHDSNRERKDNHDMNFRPPRHWTAWPLPPNEVPREYLLPESLLRGGYRKPRDERPSAELEACLTAIASRIARQRWDARELESQSEDANGSDHSSYEEDEDERPRKRRKKIASIGHSTDEGEDRSADTSMQDENSGLGRDNEEGVEGNIDNDNSRSILSSSSQAETEEEQEQEQEQQPRPAIFSSQAFLASSSSPSSSPTSSPDSTALISSSPSNSLSPSPVLKPTFLACDDILAQQLLPSTRHTLSQFDDLLSALHKIALNNRARKRRTRERSLSVASTRSQKSNEVNIADDNNNENGNEDDTGLEGVSGAPGKDSTFSISRAKQRKKYETDVGTRGAEEVFGIAEVFFSADTVERARKRWEALQKGVI